MSCFFKSTILFVLVWSSVTAVMGQNSSRAVTSPEGLRLMLGDRVLLDSAKDGFMSILLVSYAPNGTAFVAVGCGFECTDNIGFLFRSDGTGRRDLTGRWDYLFGNKLEWSTDGRSLYYYRINSTGADPPKSAPREGWVVVNLKTFRKTAATGRKLERGKPYEVFDTADGLAIRVSPGASAKEIGRIPSDGKGIMVTGNGRLLGSSVWVPITYKELKGWANQNFLFQTPTPK
jgi:hypothetical protein